MPIDGTGGVDIYKVTKCYQLCISVSNSVISAVI